MNAPVEAVKDKCFECGRGPLVGHRYCDCRPEMLCSDCFGPHTDECPSYGADGEVDMDSDLGQED